MRLVRWTGPLVAGALFGAGLVGCTAFEDHRAALSQMAATGHYAQAAAALDDPKTRGLYGGKSELLWELDRGSVALALGNDDQAVELLNRAEDRIDRHREQSVQDQVTSWMLSDAATTYIAEPYEDMYVNVIKLLAQLEAGNLSGGATVEARRLGGKADMLRDRYLKYKEELDRRAGGLGGAGRGVVSVNEKDEFVESTLGTYLSAITFLKTGNREFFRVATRRLLDSIRLQQGLIGPVREDDFRFLADARPETVDLLVVALSGRGPTKYAERVGPIPIGTFPVYFELPKLQGHPSRVARARAEIMLAGATEPSVRRLDLVEDLSAVAIEDHRRMLPLIYTRTLLRYAVKAGLAAAATEVGRSKAEDRDQGLVQVAGAILGLAFLMGTEKADLRSWIFLPGQAHVGTLNLPEGQHRVRVVYEGRGGGTVYATDWRAVQVTPDGLRTVVAYYWN
ncbi:MAG: hypothetical protein IT437_00860 [Phycisphaerales bacterium]|nr:hypothetical protein [Phycisphaerales bacterium]